MIADLHGWLFDQLSSDAALQADLGDPARLYDAVPPGRRLPCVVLSRIEASDWSTADMPGEAFLATINIWSRAQNRAELYRIADRLAALLDDADPAAGATRVVLVEPVTKTFAREREQDAHRAILRFRILCEPIAG